MQRLPWESHCSLTSPACQPRPAPAQLSESHTGARGATGTSGQPDTAASLSLLTLISVTPGGLVSPAVVNRDPEQAEQGAAQTHTPCRSQLQHLASFGAAGKGGISFPPLPFLSNFVASKRATRNLLLCEPQQPLPSILMKVLAPHPAAPCHLHRRWRPSGPAAKAWAPLWVCQNGDLGSPAPLPG